MLQTDRGQTQVCAWPCQKKRPDYARKFDYVGLIKGDNKIHKPVEDLMTQARRLLNTTTGKQLRHVGGVKRVTPIAKLAIHHNLSALLCQ